jgi:O-antigen ligase
MIGPTVRRGLPAAYLFLCLLLGGSAQGVWGNALLQVLAVLIIAWAAIDPRRTKLGRSARQLILLFLLAIFIGIVQIVPLPPAIGQALPGREMVGEGQRLLGLAPSWSSISLAPYDTMATLLTLLPPAALFLAIARSTDRNEVWLTVSLLIATFAGVLLGLLQVSSGNPTASPWYLYRFSNFGFATGFFANSNHMASLLLVALPFTIALGAVILGSTKDVRKRYSIIALTAGAISVAAIGLALNGSLAGVGLLIPVLLASLAMVGRMSRRMKLAGAAVAAIAFLGFLMLLFSPAGERMGRMEASTSLSTRHEMIATSIDAIRDFDPVGSGIGTFAKVYPLFENPASIGRTYVNHAHSDYVELAVETGVAGVALMVAFLLWWFVSVRRMWSAPNASLFAKAGAIGSAAIIVHSAVDFPLRTGAMSAVLAMCLALMLVSRTSARTSKDFREARHLVIE